MSISTPAKIDYIGRMMKPWSCGAIFAGVLLVLMFVAAFSLNSSPENNTAATLVKVHNACEAQTGKLCD